MKTANMLQVEVVTRKAQLWSGNATSVVVPAADGDLGILPKREPILAVLRAGTIRLDSESEGRLEFQVTGGFVSVDADFVTVVAEDGHML
ncbi:ATP synthase, delta/epsilon subunit, beta-sandwich domain protein [Gleimia coleocanis DSM 15436]|uniref:ATP synthase, delta/epsilon subunit, beta-sandwich domain protein n=1 Tax=Gleimia coleocanis DSM 15436 TaxID=525245 RepID=C0W006_9ACTO|nr:F0F1 ATP synthase subunit epsilon [Gleimia coleocanis]EEH63865.1 ATP synthase, delta/epsilon subunit, beta-sandwich domain protein [Gleimia coleocanis DSM 15436]